MERMAGVFVSNVHRFSVIKNIIHFLIPLSIMIALGLQPDPYQTILALLGFITAYHSIYYFNDIIDVEEDKKDPIKKATKPLARGDVTIQDYLSRMFLLLVIGLSLSFYAAPSFGWMVSALLFLNFLHSSHYIHLKETPLVGINMLIIEFLKFSSAWFLLPIHKLVEMPFSITLIFASSYILGYYAYKKPEMDVKEALLRRGPEVLAFALLMLGAYFYSLLTTEFKIPLIGLGLSSLLLALPGRLKGMKKLRTGALIIIGIYLLFVILVLTT